MPRASLHPSAPDGSLVPARSHQFWSLVSGSQLRAGSACTSSTSAAAPQPSDHACERGEEGGGGCDGSKQRSPSRAPAGHDRQPAGPLCPCAGGMTPAAAGGMKPCRRRRTCSSLRLRSAASSRTCTSWPGCEVKRKASRSTDSRTGDVARACCSALSTSVMHTGGISAMAMYFPVAVGDAGGLRTTGDLGEAGGSPGDSGGASQGAGLRGADPAWLGTDHPAPPANGLRPEEFGAAVRHKAGDPGAHATTLVGDRQGPRRKRSRTTAAGAIPGSGVRGAGVLGPEIFEDVVTSSVMLKPAECGMSGARGSPSKPMSTAEEACSARPHAPGAVGLPQSVRVAMIDPTPETNTFVELGSRRHAPFRHTLDGPPLADWDSHLPARPPDGQTANLGWAEGKSPLHGGRGIRSYDIQGPWSRLSATARHAQEDSGRPGTGLESLSSFLAPGGVVTPMCCPCCAPGRITAASVRHPRRQV